LEIEWAALLDLKMDFDWVAVMVAYLENETAE